MLADTEVSLRGCELCYDYSTATHNCFEKSLAKNWIIGAEL